MTSKNRKKNEELALEAAQTKFESMYGSYELMSEVCDRPDAGLETQGGKKIAVEITNLDQEKYLKHSKTNLKKLKNKIPEGTTENIVEDIGVSRITLIPSETAKKLAEKNGKINSYKRADIDFEKFVLLVHTDHVHFSPSNIQAKYGYLYTLEKCLKKEALQFDSLILVHLPSKEAIEVYRKGVNIFTRPKGYRALDWVQGNHFIDIKEGIVHLGGSGGDIHVDGHIGPPDKTF